MHHFKAQVGAVEYVSPGANYLTLRIQDGLVEVEAVEVECHGADAHRREPDANHWPCT